MKLTIGGKAHKAGPNGFVLHPRAHITLHVASLSPADGQMMRVSLDGHLLELFYNFVQHCVFSKKRHCGEGVSTLLTVADSVVVVPVGHAVTVDREG